MLAVMTRILSVFSCFFLAVFGRENYQVIVPFNATVTMNCTAASVIQILNITVNENTKCTPMECILSEEQKNTTKASCDEQHACDITSNIPNSCLLDLGYINYSYTCRAIAHSCNFDHGWCDWVYSPTNDNEFLWQRADDSTETEGTGPSEDHTSGSGHYAYTKADEGSLGDIAELISVGIRSSPYQCLSFWYHMHGRNIGLLRVYQIYLNHDWNMPIWNVTGAAGKAWLYQGINLTYRNDSFKIKFEGVRGNGDKGDIALDDIKITNNNCTDFSGRCQQLDSGQCRINSNEETSSEFKETCKKVDEPISLSSCSKKYMTIHSDGILFDPELDFCHDTYIKAKQSFCENADESDICTVDLYRIIQSNPECFSRYRMTIDYTCEEKTRKSSLQLKSERSNLIGIAVGVSLGCGMVASIIILIIFLIRRSNKNKNDSSIHQHNNYIGNQGVALPQQRQQKIDKIELIGDISVVQHLHDTTCTPPSYVTDDAYTYIDSMDKCTTGLGRQVDKTNKKVDLSNPSSNDTSTQNFAMSNANVRRQNDQCRTANDTIETIHDVRNVGNKYALIDPSDTCRGLFNTSGTSAIENYVVLDPNETGFNRHVNMTVEHDYCSNEHAKLTNENCLRNDTNRQNASPYEMTTEGTYDSAGISLHAVNGDSIYNHTVDDVYDESSHIRKVGEREDTYDHFLGLKTDGDYDITKCT